MNDLLSGRPAELPMPLRAKDFSDWMKVVVLVLTMLGSLATGYAGYVRLTDKVESHTQQLLDVKQDVHSLKEDESQHNTETQEKVGRIEMYLSSQDKDYWRGSAGASATRAANSARRAAKSAEDAAKSVTPKE